MKNMYARPAAMLYMKQSRLCSTVLMNAINAVIDMKRVESGMNTRPNINRRQSKLPSVTSKVRRRNTVINMLADPAKQ